MSVAPQVGKNRLMIRDDTPELPISRRRGRVIRQPRRVRRRLSRRVVVRRGIAAAAVALLAVGAAVWTLRSEPAGPLGPSPGSPTWARAHYGNPDAPGFKTRSIVEIDFLGRTMLVHEDAQRHFLRLERLFEARAPEYAATVAIGTFDDWSYANRMTRGSASAKSNHAFGLAIDVNALANVMGTAGDMPIEVVTQWEIEGGDWGGDWTRPDPMHFETHLTPAEIRERYDRHGVPKDWYLQELVGG